MLTWYGNCIISSNTAANQATTFVITDTKVLVTVGTLSTQDNAKLLQQLKSRLKGMIIWNKYQSNVSKQSQKQYLELLIDPRFQGKTDFLCYHFKLMHTNKQ